MPERNARDDAERDPEGKLALEDAQFRSGGLFGGDIALNGHQASPSCCQLPVNRRNWTLGPPVPTGDTRFDGQVEQSGAVLSPV